MSLVIAYTILIGLMMVTIVPTYSGKLLGERISREWVLPLFIVVITAVAYLVTYPYRTLTIATLAYLAFIPLSWKRFRALELQKHPRLCRAPAAEQPRNPPPSRPRAAAGAQQRLRRRSAHRRNAPGEQNR